MASATKWRMPFSLIGPMLARLGPRRSCIIALCRRSAQVSSEASGITSAEDQAASHLRPRASRSSQIAQSTRMRGRDRGGGRSLGVLCPRESGEAELDRARPRGPTAAPATAGTAAVISFEDARAAWSTSSVGAGRLRQPDHDLPAGDGVAGRLEGGVHALHAAVAVGDRAGGLGPAPRSAARPCARSAGPRSCVGEHDQRRQLARRGRAPRRRAAGRGRARAAPRAAADGASASSARDVAGAVGRDRPDARGVGVDVGVAQDVVGALGHGGPAADVDLVDAPRPRPAGRARSCPRCVACADSTTRDRGRRREQRRRACRPRRRARASHDAGRPPTTGAARRSSRSVVVGEATLVAHPVGVDVGVVAAAPGARRARSGGGSRCCSRSRSRCRPTASCRAPTRAS